MEPVTTEQPTTSVELTLDQRAPEELVDPPTDIFSPGHADDGDDAGPVPFHNQQETSDDERSFEAWIDSLEQADDEEDENESADEDQTPLWVSILEEYGHLHGIASDKLKAIAWKMQADRLKATDTLSVERFAEEVLEVYLDLTAYTSDVDDDTEDDTRSDCSSGCPACAVKAKLERGRAVDSDESDWDKDYEDEDEDEDDEKALRGATFRGPLVPARRPVMDRQEPVPVVNGFDALRELVDAMEVLDTLCTVYSKYRHKNLPRFETQVQGDSLRFDGGIPSLSW